MDNKVMDCPGRRLDCPGAAYCPLVSAMEAAIKKVYPEPLALADADQCATTRVYRNKTGELAFLVAVSGNSVNYEIEGCVVRPAVGEDQKELRDELDGLHRYWSQHFKLPEGTPISNDFFDKPE